ncbi:MAG: chloride channel protein [Actinomycetia bacterium]|nr:chloride channel protein [Actinomycetes bacterium]
MRLSAAARRQFLLIALAVLIGFLAGGAAYLLVRMIALITGFALFGEFVWGEIPELSHYDPTIRLPIVAVAGAIIIAAMARWAPVIKGHGIPETMEAVLRRQSRIQPRAGVAKPTATAIAIGTGAPFGAEGPIIVTGGALGSLVGQIIDVSPSERKILLASGAAAGMAATFGSPLASVLLAIELLLFELSIRSLIPLVVSTSIAGGIHSGIFGTGPLFEVPVHQYAGLERLPLYAVLGLTCGLVAVVINQGLFASERMFRNLQIPEFWKPAIGAIVFAVIGLIVPRSLGVGYDVIDDVLAGNLATGALAAALVAKMVAWWIALGSGTSGGTLAPVLLMSAAFGGLFASIVDEVAPGLEISTGAYAVVAMAAVFGAATRAPFTAMVFVFELTRDHDVVLPLMLATVLAALVSTTLTSESLYTEKLSRRGIRVGGELKADAFRTTAVADVMNRAVDTLESTTTAGKARELIVRRGRGAYPIIDDEGRPVGIVTRRDFLVEELDDDAPLSDVAYSDVVTIGPDANLVDALQLMVNEDISHLPVTEDGYLVGICTRADILGARNSELALERTEIGWLAPVLHRTGIVGRRYLVVANQTLGGVALMAAVEERVAGPGGSQFHVVVPLASGGELKEARDRLSDQLEQFDALDIKATGEIGDADPLKAIEAAVERLPTHEILLSTLPPGSSRWLSSDLPTRARRRLNITVTHIPQSPD